MQPVLNNNNMNIKNRLFINNFLLMGLLCFFCGCGMSQKNSQIKDTLIKKSALLPISKEISILQRDTLLINNQSLIKYIKNNQFRTLITSSGDTIVKYDDVYSNIEFPDINEDGYKDIRVFIFSVVPNQCINFFFDKETKMYKEIRDSELDIELINGTNLYYSYNPLGCSDMSWESHLSKIEDWAEIEVGLMEFYDCNDKRDGIFIYKVDGDNRKLISQLPVKKFNNNGRNNKWRFSKNYWSQNHKLFQ